jgi:hypothetical protein
MVSTQKEIEIENKDYFEIGKFNSQASKLPQNEPASSLVSQGKSSNPEQKRLSNGRNGRHYRNGKGTNQRSNEHMTIHSTDVQVKKQPNLPP